MLELPQQASLDVCKGTPHRSMNKNHHSYVYLGSSPFIHDPDLLPKGENNSTGLLVNRLLHQSTY